MGVAKYVEQGMVIISGDFSSRVSEWNDLIANDDLSYTFVNNITNIVAHSKDFALPSRNSENKTCNNLARKLLDLCNASGLRMCKGRCADKSCRVTFLIALGQASLIKFLCTGIIMIFISFYSPKF